MPPCSAPWGTFLRASSCPAICRRQVGNIAAKEPDRPAPGFRFRCLHTAFLGLLRFVRYAKVRRALARALEPATKHPSVNAVSGAEPRLSATIAAHKVNTGGRYTRMESGRSLSMAAEYAIVPGASR
jgi:hypothetical protein